MRAELLHTTRTARDYAHQHLTFFVSIAAALGGVLVYALLVHAFSEVGEVARSAIEPHRPPPSGEVRELPREWQWSEPGVRYEHMYAPKREPKSPWLRQKGRDFIR